MDNYRPISNLFSMDKLSQKVVLNELNRRHPGKEGSHQHGFKPNHSTSTAMLEIQAAIIRELDASRDCLLFSVDLSAAFDLLRPKTFWNALKNEIDSDLMSILMDFLTDREMYVENN